jgi:hypothetical protein
MPMPVRQPDDTPRRTRRIVSVRRHTIFAHIILAYS